MNKLSLNLSPLLIEKLQAYSQWVVDVWDEPKEGYLLRDHAIMTLGLCGESSEVVETVEKANQTDSKDALKKSLTKELGDCLYYTVMIAKSQGYGFSSHQESSSALYNLKDLPYYSGFIAEKYKKEIRKSPDIPNIDIKAQLEEYFNVLIWCCEQHTDGFLHVMQENEIKLNDRLRRNVLIGEGNDR
mgnify:CR=1 FL=1